MRKSKNITYFINTKSIVILNIFIKSKLFIVTIILFVDILFIMFKKVSVCWLLGIYEF
jgi:hypothetical protein